MKDYLAMTDFEINKRVLKLHLGMEPLCHAHDADGRSVSNKVFHWYDFCNNPSDAWGVIFKNKISIDSWHDSDEWTADRGPIYASGENPLRAAMIVFLMMKDAEKGHG